MPIYEYECDGCQTVFEVRQKVSDPAPTEHTCGSSAIRRILSATSFVLKGTGWYATDYGNRSQAAQSQGTTETKTPAPKAEGKTAATPSAAPATSSTPPSGAPKSTT